MDLEHLRTFCAVARCGTFTAAAQVLHVAQSTVSVHVRALEAEIGTAVFDRFSSGARLTEAGRRLLPLAERILELAAAAAAVGRDDGEAVGEVRVAAPESVVAHRLPPVLRHLHDHHPTLSVRLEAVPYHEIPSAVARGEIDVGYLLQPPLASTSSLAVTHLRSEVLLLVAGADHPLATPVDDVAEAFSHTTLFLTERGCGYRHLLEGHLADAGVRPGHTLEFDSVEAIRRCVEAGLGVALLPEMWLAGSLAAGTLVTLDWFAPRFEVAVQLVVSPARSHGPALRAVVAASMARMGDVAPRRWAVGTGARAG